MSLTNKEASTKDETLIVDVYRKNFLKEMKSINQAIAEGFCMIALDTEFPGIIYFPKFENKFQNFFSECIHLNSKIIKDYNFETIRLNVDYLKLIQIGITLFNPKSEEKRTWQFNMDFDLHTEKYSSESIELLEKSGINFRNLKENGIKINQLAEYFMISGLVLNSEVIWITFHGNYDFAYILKMLINQPLPDKEEEFLNLMNIYFPNFYDLKYLLKNSNYLEGGLNKLSKILNINRIGYQHQAGSDSLLTIEIFLKLQKNYFNKTKLFTEINNIWGMSEDYDGAQILDHLLKNYTFATYFYTNRYYQMANNGVKKNPNSLNYICEKSRRIRVKDFDDYC